MAKLSKVEACLFCGNLPCTCNAKPKAVARPKATKAAPFKQDIPKSEPRAKFARDAGAVDDDKIGLDYDLVAAIRNLAPILHPIDRRKYSHVTRPIYAGDYERRALEWRKRNANP